MQRLDLYSADRTRLTGWRWDPPEVRGDVLLVHGLAEHLGRYGHVVRALNAAGYRVTGVELRGHGSSDGRRGHVDTWAQYVEDLRAAAAAIGGPHAILAHSMGGLVALDHLREGSAWAAVVTAPLLGVAVRPPRWKVAAANVLSRWLPRLPMSNELDTRDISTDPEVVRAYEADPLVYGTVTPRWFTEMNAARERVLAHAERYEVPLLAAWGTGDRITSGAAIEAFASRYGGPVETRPYEGLFHEILNEPDKEAILDGIVTWLDARLESVAA